jgi:hypothetical protein
MPRDRKRSQGTFAWTVSPWIEKPSARYAADQNEVTDQASDQASTSLPINELSAAQQFPTLTIKDTSKGKKIHLLLARSCT